MDDETGKFSSDPKLTFKHPYPPTKIMFIPDKEGTRPDLLATTGDFLRIWQVGEDSVQMHKLLNNVRGPPPPSTALRRPPKACVPSSLGNRNVALHGDDTGSGIGNCRSTV